MLFKYSKIAFYTVLNVYKIYSPKNQLILYGNLVHDYGARDNAKVNTYYEICQYGVVR